MAPATAQVRVVDEAQPAVCGAPKKRGGLCTRKTDGGPCALHAHLAQEEARAAPDSLGDQGVSCWDRWYRRFEKAGRLGALDRSLLELACQTYETIQLAWSEVKAHGMMIDNGRGAMKTNPAVSKHLAYTRQYGHHERQLLALLGEEPEGESEPDGDASAAPKGIKDFL